MALEYIGDIDAAAYYFRLAAETRNPTGQRGLGRMMANGMGMNQDISGAVEFNAVSVLDNEYGWSVKEKLELLSWTEGGVTDKELTEFVPWP